MEELIFLMLGLLVLAFPVAMVVLIVQVTTLRRRVRTLEETQRNLASRMTALSEAARAPLPQTPAPSEPPGPTPAQSETPQDKRPDIPDDSDAYRAPPPPWPVKPAAKPATTGADLSADGPAVFRKDRFSDLANWLRGNWFYVVSAVSLALAGLFLVQYGIDNGYLPPKVRVVAAFAFGVLLVLAGETIRRRYGDDENSPTAYLPSVFTGAGIVSMFGAVLAARVLYDFLSPGPAIAGLAAIALFSLFLGWKHGPLLAAVGLIGGMAAPFIVGGTSDAPEFLYVYFAGAAALGLGIDTLRRWAWVSVLSLVLATGAGLALFDLSGGTQSLAAALMVYAVALVAMATLIPARSLRPDHPAPSFVQMALGARRNWPVFPVRLSAGTMTVAVAIIVWGTHPGGAALFWLALILLSALAGLALIGSVRGEGLTDHAVAPSLGMLAVITISEARYDVQSPLRAAANVADRGTDGFFSWDVTWVLLLFASVATVAAWRSLRGGPLRLPLTILATLLPPVAGLALELDWRPEDILGTPLWAWHAIAVAALMTVMATWFARVDGNDRVRASLAALSALAAIAFALGVMLTTAALTLALAATVVGAAALDRRFNLPFMELYIAALTVGLGYRMVIDPGLDWAERAPVATVALAYLGTAAAFAAARLFINARHRARMAVWCETGAFLSLAIGTSVLLIRAIQHWSGVTATDTHWALGLYATIWSAAALVQMERRRGDGSGLDLARAGLAGVYAAVATLPLLAALQWANPLAASDPVMGWPLINTLAPAYLVPALAMAAGAWRQRARLPGLSRVLWAVSGALGVFWFALCIRHFWQGGEAMRLREGIGDPELYSYTVALLVAGAVLFYQSLARNDAMLRRIGLTVIGLAVAKVFLIDISGLGGLIRVFSLLFLGLALAGLAWLNKWAETRGTTDPKDPTQTDG